MRHAYKVETLEDSDIPTTTLVELPPRTRRLPSARRTELAETVRPPVMSMRAAPGEEHRRASPRRMLSARMSLRTEAMAHYGWTLNVSDGGLRVLVEDSVIEHGSETTVEVREDACSWQRKARVVWVQREPGGCIAGLQFLQATSIFGSGPANDTQGVDILSDSEPIYSSKFSFG